MSKYLFKEFRLPEYSLVHGYVLEDAPPIDKAYKEFMVDGERRIILPAGPEYDD